MRVFIDHGDPNRKDNDGAVQNNYLSKQYMDNVATFVQLASKLNIYTIPTLELFPSYTSRYGCNATALEQKLFPYPNAALFIPGCVRAKRQYAIDFLHELKQRLGSLSALGMVFIENELSISVGSQPFIGNEALVKSANGQEYNMKNASQRLQLYEESARFWSSQVRNGIKSVDENVLVGVGMFTYAAVGKTFASSKNLTKCKFKEDCRVPPRPSAIENVIDVLDVHVYQTPSWTGIAVDLASSDWQSLKKTTPIVMAEFGAFRKNPMVFANQTEAATAMVQQQIDSCKFGFSGWLFWTADTWEQPILWNFASAPKIGKYLSPKARVDPCSSSIVSPPSSTSSFPLYWNVAASSTVCNPCPPGSKSNVSGANISTVCATCEVGKVSSSGSDKCTECPHGRTSLEGSAVCSSCTTGRMKIGNNVNNYTCNDCKKGTVAQARDTSCTNCTAGLYQSDTGQGTCQPCKSGTWSDREGSSSSLNCIHCDPGLYSTATGSSTKSNCNSCPPGSKSNVLGAKNSTVCLDCEEGKASGSGSIECTHCPAGQSQDKTGSASCLSCQPGKYTKSKGSTICDNCRKNYFTKDPSSSTCKKCDMGRYTLKSGQASCIACAAGKYGINIRIFAGKGACEECPIGYKRAEDEDTTKCVQCHSLVPFQPLPYLYHF